MSLQLQRCRGNSHVSPIADGGLESTNAILVSAAQPKKGSAEHKKMLEQEDTWSDPTKINEEDLSEEDLELKKNIDMMVERVTESGAFPASQSTAVSSLTRRSHSALCRISIQGPQLMYSVVR